MARSVRRSRSLSPDELALRAAERRAAERTARRKPENFGVSLEHETLATSAHVELTIGGSKEAKKVLAARRQDPFDLLYAAGGLTRYQHLAARRLFKDRCERIGVRTEDRPDLYARIDGGGGSAELVTDAMLAAAARVTAAMLRVGPANARLLQALTDPMLTIGHVPDWRAIVAATSGETDRHAQGAAVRQACENLRLVYRIGEEASPTPANDDIPLHQCGGLA